MLNKVPFTLINEGFLSLKCTNIYFVAYIQLYIEAVGFVFFTGLFLLTTLVAPNIDDEQESNLILTVGVNFIFQLLSKTVAALTLLSGL